MEKKKILILGVVVVFTLAVFGFGIYKMVSTPAEYEVV